MTIISDDVSIGEGKSKDSFIKKNPIIKSETIEEQVKEALKLFLK